jgi:hypothetical protein
MPTQRRYVGSADGLLLSADPLERDVGQLFHVSAHHVANLFLNIPAHIIRHIIYIRHVKMVLWYTRGHIPDIIPQGCGGLAESRTGFNKNIPKSHTHILIQLICRPA